MMKAAILAFALAIASTAPSMAASPTVIDENVANNASSLASFAISQDIKTTIFTLAQGTYEFSYVLNSTTSNYVNFYNYLKEYTSTGALVGEVASFSGTDYSGLSDSRTFSFAVLDPTHIWVWDTAVQVRAGTVSMFSEISHVETVPAPEAGAGLLVSLALGGIAFYLKDKRVHHRVDT